MQARPIELRLTPREALAAWPDGAPLAALVSGGPGGPPNPRARWSILARPDSTRRLGDDATRPLEALREMLASTAGAPADATTPGPPFRGGWIGYVSYDLGRRLEPRAASARGAAPDHPWPSMEWHRCPGAYVFDGAERRWWAVGDASGLPRTEQLESGAPKVHAPPTSVGPLTSVTGRAAFERQVARAVELIHAGDVFQVNLAHRLRGRCEGSARALFGRLASEAQPWYGAYLESADGALLSLSPELFLEFDAGTRRVVTRPMKGTRAAGRGERDRLLLSAKDAAELNMIVDLMRNDLGRVCAYGSVRVDEGRVVEGHGGGGVLQGVATVSGIVRDCAGVPELLGAAFPPGSVTGAPKIRAMQIIDELEPVRRGPYCGAIGYLSDHGHVALSVAIRTALLTRHGPVQWDLSYSVGAGIVAESDPAEEWRETLVKAGAIARFARIEEAAR